MMRFCTFLLLALTVWAISARAQPRGVYREVYTNITGSALANLTNHANFPNSPSTVDVVTNFFESFRDAMDNYGQRMRALILPPTTGSYIFWLASDDNGGLWLSTDESPANKALVARVNGATGYREWTREVNQQSAAVTLEGGRRYYIEALQKEGIGGDNLTVRWSLPGGAIEEPIPAARLLPYGGAATTPPIISSQPTNVTVIEGATVAFRVGVSNLDSIAYQWQRDGTNITNATGSTYTISIAALTDSGAIFRCVLTNALGITNSADASLTVLADTNAPTLFSVLNLGSNIVQVTFSEPVEVLTATNRLNYQIDPGVLVTVAAFGANTRTIHLTTQPLIYGSNYTLTVNNVRDRAATPNTIATNSQNTFTALVKGIYREVFTGIFGTNVASLTNHASFPNGPAVANLLTNFFETPSDFADYYGQRLRALIVPPVDGSYTFWIAGDESATLFLGTNDLPSSKSVIAFNTIPARPRQWTTQTNQTSATLTLVGGKKYYIEALMKENSGTDNLAVRWQLPDGSFEEPISAARLTPVGMNLPVISVQPTNTTAVEGGAALFQVSISNVDPVTYQWQRNGINIAGATNAAYTNLAVSLTNAGAAYSCIVANPMGSTNSAAAILTVTPDVTLPTIANVLNNGTTNVVVIFSEPVEAASATNRTNYVISGVTISAASFRSNDTRMVSLNTSPLVVGNGYTLTVNNVRDRAATPNTIATNAQWVFVAALFFPQDIGNPALPGSSTLAGNGVNIVASGSDIGGTSDQFNFSYQQRTGDFNVAVRVQLLELSDAWAKAGLMARETLNADSRFAAVIATPSINGTYFQYRSTIAAASVLTNGFPVNYPNTWLRLQRAGNVFTGFASYDGQTWTQLGSVTIALPTTIFFGMAVTSRDALQTTSAQFRDLADVVGGTIGALPVTTEPLGPSSRRTGLVISEIMYHSASRADGRNLEFVELYNAQPFPEDISGYRLSGQVDFTFPPGTVFPGGGFIVVARNPTDLQTVYGLSNVRGPYTNSLSNKSGTVRLRNKQDAVLLEVNYSSKPPWPIAADGVGHSLVLARPSLGEGNPAAWAQSDVVGGSPGTVDGLRFEPVRNVVINEFLAHTDLPDVDYIELYNHSNVAVDLSGCSLSDDPATNKFTISSGTMISPRGFLFFTETNLGFALSSGGESIYFVNSNRTRVLDAVQFEGQANGVSSGRFPDGAPTFRPLASKTPGTNNSGLLVRDIVLNEIMYHPVSEDSNDEWVELHNRGGSAVNLGGWKFTDGITFTFPGNTSIPANGYLVVARNVARLLTNYPNLNAANTVGNFSGSLADSGERLALSMPDEVISTNNNVLVTNTIYIVVDEVSYGEGGRWGRWSDGGGSSLELIDARSDHRQPSNWADSDDTAKSVWTTLETTGILDNGSSTIDSLQIFLLSAGEALVDNVEFIGVAGTNLIANSTFESGFTNWFAQGNQIASNLETNGGFNSSRCLHLRASGRGDTGANRVRTALSPAPAANSIGTIRAKVRWLHGRPEMLLRTHGNYLEVAGTMTLPTNLGTPGARNSQAVENAGPAIYDVAHNPILPAANQSVLVTARVNDPDGVAALTMNYRVDPTATLTTVTMVDNGTGGDAVANDGIFTATIPAQTNGALVAFHVQASDNFVPSATAKFPSDAPVRECLVRFGETVPFGGFGKYRIWITQNTFATWSAREKLSNDPLDATFVYGNSRVIYNMGAQYSGSPYHAPGYNTPTGNGCDYVLVFPDDNRFMGDTDLSLLQPGNGGGDTTAIREIAAYWLANQVGLPFNYNRHVLFFVNGVRRGTFLLDTQQPNSDFVNQWYFDDPDGELHKIQIWFEFDDPATVFTAVGATLGNFTSGGVKKLARYRFNWAKRAVQGSPHNFTNLFALVDTMNTTATGAVYTAQVEAAVDVDEWFRTLAIEHIVGNTDSYGYGGGQNMFTYKPVNGPWRLHIWDIDFAFAAAAPTADLFGFSDGINTRMFSNPPFRRSYYRALADAVNGPLVAANFNPFVDKKYEAMIASGVGVATPDSTKTYASQRRDYILSELAKVEVNFAITNNGGLDFSTATNVVSLSGSAPINIKSITVNGAAYPVTWTSLTNWTLLAPVSGSNNVLTVQGYDSQGNPVTNATRTINVTFTGTVLRPQDFLVINEIMYHPKVTNASYVEIHNRSTNITFNLSNYRLNGIDFIFTPGTTIAPRGFVVVAKDTNIFRATYGTNLSLAGQFSGQLDPDGETLSLVQPGLIPAEDVLIDRVRYESKLPWPESANGQGPSLQLIDPGQDNSRAGNWADGRNWQFFSFTGKSFGSRMLVFLGAVGDVYIDELSLVAGSVPGVGTNQVRNGDFESDLSGPWLFSSTGTTNTAITSSVKHSGSNSLHLVFNQAGSPANYMYQDLIPIVTNATYTVSYWFLPGAGTNTLTTRTTPGSSFIPVNTISVSAPYTPGTTNSVAQALTPFPQLWINELQPNNLSGSQDHAGDRDPWIELFNAGTNAASLDGFYLTDNYANLLAWPFPSNTIINPGQFLIVWADGEPGESLTNELHTSFRLNAATGSVALVRGLNNQPLVLDYVNYGSVGADRSYGSFPDGQPYDRQVFQHVTPGASNNPASIPIAVLINEWMALNVAAVEDPSDHKFDDWFELYNPGTNNVNLSGYFLTDNLTNKTQWEIPANTIISAKGFLLVWADQNAGANGFNNDLHANFKLSQGGEAIGLFAPDGTTIDAVTFGTQAADVSQGRFPDGQAGLYFMTNSTPRSANYIYQVNAPPMLEDMPPRVISEGQLLIFTASATDTNYPPQTLTYTLDGAVPEGAGIHPNSGLFTWRPTSAQTPSTNNFVVRVTDNGSPNLSASKVFTVVVIPFPHVFDVSRSGDNLTVVWQSYPEKIYRVQYTDDLATGNWITLGEDVVATGLSTMFVYPIENNEQRFYRILQLN